MTPPPPRRPPRRAAAGSVAALLTAAALLAGCATPVTGATGGPSLAPSGAVGYVACPGALTPVELGKQMQKLGLSADGLTRAAARARSCGRPQAARDLADLVESMGGAPEGGVLPLTRRMPAPQARLQGAAA